MGALADGGADGTAGLLLASGDGSGAIGPRTGAAVSAAVAFLPGGETAGALEAPFDAVGEAPDLATVNAKFAMLTPPFVIRNCGKVVM